MKTHRLFDYLFLLPTLTVISYFFSLYLYEIYYSGDLVHYRSFFSSLKDIEFSDVHVSQYNITGSAEPIFGALMYLGSNLDLDHDVYLSLFNAFLIFNIIFYLIKNKVNYFFILIIILNYYLLILMTGAERLKFGYLFLIMALNSSGALKYIFAFFSVLSHFQMFIMWISFYTSRTNWMKMSVINNYKLIILIIVSFIFISSNSFFDVIMSKVNYYLNSGNYVKDTSYIFTMIVISLLLFDNKKSNFIYFLFVWFFALALGGGRVNMIAMSYLIYLFINSKYKNSLWFFAVLTFCSYKSFNFFENIKNCGNGFC